MKTLTLVIFLSFLKLDVCAQNSLIVRLEKTHAVSNFDGYSFTCQNNSEPYFSYRGQAIEINYTDTVPLIVFNTFISETLYPRRRNKLIPKIIEIKGENNVDSIKVTDSGKLESYLLEDKSRCSPKIVPVVKRIATNSVIEFILFTDTPEGIFVECYSYNREKKRVISYLPLFRGEKRNKQSCTSSGICITAAYQTLQIKNGIFGQRVNDGFNDLWSRKMRINEDGFYELLWTDHPQKKSKIYNAVINDSDGYTNVRKYPNGKSPIIYKIIKSEKFQIEETLESKDWYKIFTYKDYNEGWIHKSRVTKQNP